MRRISLTILLCLLTLPALALVEPTLALVEPPDQDFGINTGIYQTPKGLFGIVIDGIDVTREPVSKAALLKLLESLKECLSRADNVATAGDTVSVKQAKTAATSGPGINQ